MASTWPFAHLRLPCKMMKIIDGTSHYLTVEITLSQEGVVESDTFTMLHVGINWGDYCTRWVSYDIQVQVQVILWRLWKSYADSCWMID